MSSTHPTLAYVQQAGHAVSTAREQLHSQLQRQVEKLASVVTAQPFGPEADRAYAQLRAAARMAQELQSIEDQLVQVYKAAAQFEEEQDIQVLVALPGRGSKIESAPAENVVDAEEVQPRRRTPKPHVPHQSTGKAKGRKEKPHQNAKVSNEIRLLDGLRKHLNKRSWTSMTQSQMAKATGIPQGSVGAALNRVIKSGQLLVGERGKYRLV